MFDFSNYEAVPLIIQQYLGPPDNRVKKWFLLNSPLNVIIILSMYIVLLIGGKKIMNKQKPMNLKYILVIYNTFQILYSCYIFKEIFLTAYLSNYNLTCVVLDKSNNELALRMARAIWLSYISKVIDLLDTMFFVLRKKKLQLTFLHCYHHSTMICNWYVGALYLPGGQAFLSVLLNSFVHIIMYTYYLLSAMGPKLQKYLWWKKYLTQIQLTQFFIVIIHIIRSLMNNCDAPKWLAYFTLIYLITLVILFMNFYICSYIYKKRVNRNKSIFTITNKKMECRVEYDYKAGGDWKYD